jgi:oxaloacetate decarboxylase alpha subunit
MELAIRCIVRNGIRRIWIAESMNDVRTAVELAGIARAAGAEEVLVGLVFSVSPVHTDDYYAARARAVAASSDVDVLNLKDPGGLLTPERVATLVPALRSAAPALPLEVHTHMTVSMGEESYLAAVAAGARFVCTAARPLANGTSQPATERVVELLRANGHEVDVDDAAVGEISAYFTRLAAELGRETGRLLPRDESVYRHQLPGGMTSTLRRQLAEVGMEDRWDDVLAELPRVREELGWPIMVTPLSQYVAVQAFLNVTSGERYAQMPDEVVKLVLGHYGDPPGEIDPDVRARALRAPEPPEHRLDLAAARARYGDGLPDEELLLRMVLPPAQVESLYGHPVVTLVHELAKRDLSRIEVAAGGMRLRMQR